MKQIKTVNFVAVQVETTGLFAETDEMIYLCAVKVCEDKITDCFSTYIKPAKPIPALISKITGITDETVKNAPSIVEAMKRFIDFTGKFTVVGYNVKFELSFINKYLKDNNLPQYVQHIDVVKLAKKKMPYLKSYRFAAVCKELCIGETADYLDETLKYLNEAVSTAKAYQILRNKKFHVFNKNAETERKTMDRLDFLKKGIRQKLPCGEVVKVFVSFLKEKKVSIDSLMEMLNVPYDEAKEIIEFFIVEKSILNFDFDKREMQYISQKDFEFLVKYSGEKESKLLEKYCVCNFNNYGSYNGDVTNPPDERTKEVLLNIVVDNGAVSKMMLQGILRIGYRDAAELVDWLTANKYVDDSVPVHKGLIGREDLIKLYPQAKDSVPGLYEYKIN